MVLFPQLDFDLWAQKLRIRIVSLEWCNYVSYKVTWGHYVFD